MPQLHTLLYANMHQRIPKNIIEVGSGHSTRFMARTASDGLLDTKLVAIDPAPRASLDGLNIMIENKTVQEMDVRYFDLLEPGDILFIDSSHILMPATDVDFLFNRVLPRLQDGIIIHLHDIFLPDDYPKEWQWRGYHEQLIVVTLLQAREFNIFFPSNYVATRMGAYLRGTLLGELDRPVDWFETNLWLKKTVQ